MLYKTCYMRTSKLLSAVFCMLFLVPAFNAGAQVEFDRYKKVANLFFAHYEANNYEGIYQLYSDDFKKTLPLEKTVVAITNLKTRMGGYKSRTLSGYDGRYAQYKTEFENGSMMVNISLDSKQKVDGLFFKPE